MTAHRPLNTSPLPLRLRLEDYLALDESGAFTEYAKTELIGGELFYVNAQHRPHASAKMKIYDGLRDTLRDIRSSLRPLVEASIAFPPDAAPEPDILLTNEPDGEGLVPLRSVALVIEASDTTLHSDLGRKARLYASGGIPEYWVVDIAARVIHALAAPAGNTFASHREIVFGGDLTAATIPGLTVSTARL